jgi:hypothetical protein
MDSPSESRTSGRKEEPWLNGDVMLVPCDFALVCVAHMKVDIFQGSGVEIHLSDWDWRDDGDITEEQFVEHLDEVWVEEDEIPALASNGSGLFFLW